MKFAAFADMLKSRLIVVPPTDSQPSSVRFKLYRAFALGEQPEDPTDLLDVDGAQFLHISYLSEGGYEEIAALA